MAEKENYKYILAIDVGTQSTRAAIVSPDGKIMGMDQIKHEIDAPYDGWAQQRPEEWWNETCEVVIRVLDETDISPEAIAGVSVCGQMHGPVGITKDGTLTTEWVQLWCDKRCVDQVSAIMANNNVQELMRITGNPPNTAWIAMKVRWEKDNNRAQYEKTQYYLVPKDFINYKLTGIARTDHSEASASYIYDINTGSYSDKLAQIVGVDKNKFAPIQNSTDIIGYVNRESAAFTGLLEGTPVVAGGGDFPISMLGFGIVGDGATADVTGTSSILAIHSSQPMIDDGLMNCRHVVDGWISFSILDSGGFSMKWCRDLFSSIGKELSYEEMIKLAFDAPPGCEGLIFQPYLTGERRIDNVNGRGSFNGLKPRHNASHMIRSVMEGVVFSIGKDAGLFQKFGQQISEIFSVGGGTKNRLWNEIKASVLGVPMHISDEPEAGIKGAALVGAGGVGLIDNLYASAKERRIVSKTIIPDPESILQYHEIQKEFNRIYKHNLGFYSDLLKT